MEMHHDTVHLRIMETMLFYIFHYNDIKYKIETIVDRISELAIIRISPYVYTVYVCVSECGKGNYEL